MLHFMFSIFFNPCVSICSTGHKEESPMEDSQGPLFRSPNLSDVLQASSLELSPSNSSGGTYMWDEDGLEPLVGAGTNPCNSYDDSELNSMVSPSLSNPPVQSLKRTQQQNTFEQSLKWKI